LDGAPSHRPVLSDTERHDASRELPPHGRGLKSGRLVGADAGPAPRVWASVHPNRSPSPTAGDGPPALHPRHPRLVERVCGSRAGPPIGWSQNWVRPDRNDRADDPPDRNHGRLRNDFAGLARATKRRIAFPSPETSAGLGLFRSCDCSHPDRRVCAIDHARLTWIPPSDSRRPALCGLWQGLVTGEMWGDPYPISIFDIGYRFIVREFLRGAVRLHILHHAAQGEVHGAWMAEELANHGYSISPGSLYPTLHKMEAEGLLRSRQHVIDGRPRRSYTITVSGRRALRETTAQLRALADEVLGSRP
jgi:DNA-binding PadR family transcriptional regulator